MSTLDAFGDTVFLQLYLIARLQGSPTWVKGLRWFKESNVLMIWSYEELALYVLNSDLRLLSYAESDHIRSLGDKYKPS